MSPFMSRLWDIFTIKMCRQNTQINYQNFIIKKKEIENKTVLLEVNDDYDDLIFCQTVKKRVFVYIWTSSFFFSWPGPLKWLVLVRHTFAGIAGCNASSLRSTESPSGCSICTSVHCKFILHLRSWLIVKLNTAFVFNDLHTYHQSCTLSKHAKFKGQVLVMMGVPFRRFKILSITILKRGSRLQNVIKNYAYIPSVETNSIAFASLPICFVGGTREYYVSTRYFHLSTSERITNE